MSEQLPITQVKKAFDDEQRRRARQMRCRVIRALNEAHSASFVALANTLYPLADDPLAELEFKTFAVAFDAQRLSVQLLQALGAEQDRQRAAVEKAVRLRSIAEQRMVTLQANLNCITSATQKKVIALVDAGFDIEKARQLATQSTDERETVGALTAEIARLDVERADLDKFIRTRDDATAPQSIRPLLQKAIV